MNWVGTGVPRLDDFKEGDAQDTPCGLGGQPQALKWLPNTTNPSTGLQRSRPV